MLATVLAYSNTLHAPFVYDDVLAIPDNPTIRQLWPPGRVLLPQAEGGLTVSGRPILNLSFALNYAVSGTAVWSYHVFNILVHAGAGLLLFGIVRRTLRLDAPGSIREDAAPAAAAGVSEWTTGATAANPGERPAGPRAGARSHGSGAVDATVPAFAIALLWTLHPLQTQAVTYTVQRAESLTGFFYLLTLYAFVRAADGNARYTGAASRGRAATEFDVIRDQRPARRWLGLSVGACVLGMGTKEIMATAPLIVLLFDRTFVAGRFAAAWRARRGYYVALASTWLLLGALVASTGGNRGGTAGLGVGVPLWAYPLTQFEAVTRYLGLSAWPHPLVFEYGTFWVQRVSDVWPFAAIVLPLLAATAVALWRWPVAGFLGASFFVILAPTSLTPGTIQMIVEHRMYLPLAAVLTGLTWLARQFGPARAAHAALVGVALGFGVLTFQRNGNYGSHLALWSDTVAKRPDNPRAHEGLAEAWEAAGRPELAARHRAESIRLRPDESTYHYNLGLNHMTAGRLPEAVRSFQQALRLTPDEPRTHNNLAIVLGRLGRTDEALAHYTDTVRLRPDEAQYQYNFGVALARAGRSEEAMQRFRETLRLRPDHADAHFNLGSALVVARRLEEALRHYGEALRIRPDDPDYRNAHGGALLIAGRAAEAEAEFRKALGRKPDSIDAQYGLGNALAARRRPAEAVAHYEAVLRRQPDHANARFKLGNALLDLDRVAEAVTHFDAAIRLRPDDAESHHNLGVAYARQERWDDARREFETALRLRPDYADARRNLEQLRSLLGR